MRKKSFGFSLLEALISIIIFSMALLGLNAMDIFTMREQLNSYYTSLAIQQIQNIEERLSTLGKQAGLNDQVKLWNLQNEVLLPSGKGEVLGQYPRYFISLFWGDSNCKDRQEEKVGCIKEELSLQ